MNNNKDQVKEKDNKSLTKPDEETLDTTDPQEHMEGPISSIVQSVKEKADNSDDDVEKNATNIDADKN